MIVFTEPGDTPESVVNRHFGYNDASKAKQLRDANRNGFAWQIMNSSGYYSANRALWFPVEGEDTSPNMQALIAHEFDWLTGDQRATLAQAQKLDINVHDMLHAHRLNTFANIAMGTGVIALDSLHAGIEIRHDRMTEFEKLVKQANESLGNIADSATPEARLAARQVFGNIYKEIVTRYHRYFKQMSGDAQYQLKKPWQTVRTMKKPGWMIDDLFDAKRIAAMTKFLRFSVIGGYAIMIVGGMADTVETWKHTHNWEATAKEALKVIVDIGTVWGASFLVAGALVLAGFTAPEWVTCLIVGAGAIALADFLDKKVFNPLIEEI